MEFDFCVIGGGIVGLATASRLSQFGSTLVIDQHSRFIHETSSRNSGVVHSGVYYPPTSLKTTLCIQGNKNLWTLAERYPNQIQARKIGKWIGATDSSEERKLSGIVANMQALQVPHRMLTQTEMQRDEPLVRFKEAVLSPETGIVDVSSLSDFFLWTIAQRGNGSLAATNLRASDIIVQNQCGGGSCSGSPVEVMIEGEAEPMRCSRLVMSMGLHTEKFWSGGALHWQDNSTCSPLPLDKRCKTYFCKGRYVGYRGKIVSRLVYPCPLSNLTGLGVHSVVDMAGNVRFGPDAHYVDDKDDLAVSDDSGFLDDAFEAVKKFIPSVQRDKMFVDFAGMRPKLSGDGQPFRDFHIDFLEQPASATSLNVAGGRNGKLDHVVVLAGIESPGLTSCTSIADTVCTMLVGEEMTRTVSSPWA